MNATPSSTDFSKGLAQPAIRALYSAGVSTLECSRSTSVNELLTLHATGAQAMHTLKTALPEHDMHLNS
jgi:hypothetical protein